MAQVASDSTKGLPREDAPATDERSFVDEKGETIEYEPLAGTREAKERYGAELKRFGILVNSIAPGGMVTPGSASNLCSEGISEEKQDEFYDELAVWSTPDLLPVDQVATMAYMMCTPASDGVTGETIFVNGGANHNIFTRQVAIEAYPPEDE